jgi:hypothetical protein
MFANILQNLKNQAVINCAVVFALVAMGALGIAVVSHISWIVGLIIA